MRQVNSHTYNFHWSGKTCHPSGLPCSWHCIFCLGGFERFYPTAESTDPWRRRLKQASIWPFGGQMLPVFNISILFLLGDFIWNPLWLLWEYFCIYFFSLCSFRSYCYRKPGWWRWEGFASLERNRLRSALRLPPATHAGLSCSEGSALECRHGRGKTHTLTALWIKSQNCTSLGSCHCRDSHTTL